MKYSTVTDYAALYGTGYFAHQPEASSFDQQSLPRIIAEFCRENQIAGLVDIGAGNGLFGRIIRENGIDCIDVDVTERDDAHFIKCDFSRDDAAALATIKQRCSAQFGKSVLVTSFDMAEHVDLEHIADFIYNFSEIVEHEAIISISTRPSSRANLYHATILPIDTWKYMFGLVGLEASSFEPLQARRSGQQFRSDSQELFAVSVWQKRNLFHDHESHQHYLKLTRSAPLGVSRQDVKSRLSDVLDLGYRTAKRALVSSDELPYLTYLVSFVQDWPFVRSLLEIWPSARVRVLLRRDFLVNSYAEMIESYLRRVGVMCHNVTTVADAARILEQCGAGQGELFVTATEGLETVIHGLASLTTLEARQRGMTTLTLQHGELISKHTAHGAQFFGAMNSNAAADLARSAAAPETVTPIVLGALKRLDSVILTADPDAIAFRLGSYAKHYARRILVGTNLHWLAHQSESGQTFDWLTAAADRYPDYLFLVRPHPDDWVALGATDLAARSNVIILDETTLMCVDWPLSRVIAAVDLVISTHSTLVGDALAAGKPTLILPTAIVDPALLVAEAQWLAQGAVCLTPQDIAEGSIPEIMHVDRMPIAPRATEIETNLFATMLALVGLPDDAARIADASAAVQAAFLADCRNLSLDSHPHSSRQKVSASLSAFARDLPVV